MVKPEDANRERLVQFLRDEDTQRREKFSWDFEVANEVTPCGMGGCAIGAAQALGIIGIGLDREDERLCVALGLPRERRVIFFDRLEYPVEHMSDVTASMVADKIEEVAAEAGR